ncbi:MAG: bifunctional DNA-formamidopyrimidine glycosylase/DNA-(apurinic or apyrimidinic site) lyase [Acidimicrobiia bacterium]
MPELPEVETVRRQLEPLVVGRRLVEGWGFASPKFAAAPDAVGPSVEAIGRRGKYLLVGLDDGRELVLHLGMTGRLAVRPAGADHDPYVRAWWALDDGNVLALRDVRRFGRLAVVAAGDYASLPTLARQGPDPWDPVLDGDGFWRRTRASRARVKTQLLSQRPLAGVGNIYADEALWAARVHPARRSLTRSEAVTLLGEVRAALARGLANDGTTLRDYRRPDGGEGRNQHHLACYGRAGLPCLRCGTALRRAVYDGRGTTFCRACQPSR